MTRPGSAGLLPSWRRGATRDAVIGFLDQSDEIPPADRVAVFDNDGTLWCEKPRYPQLDFFAWQLRAAASDDPGLATLPEYDAVLRNDLAAIAQVGLPRVALALLRLFDGVEPQVFIERVEAFFAETRHPDLGVRYDALVYQPMLELLDELEDRGFANCIVTGGGTEFVRAVSQRLYGVPPERTVGTLVTYRFHRRDGRPVLLRSSELEGAVNEGAAKIANLQVGLGRRPVLGAGNSPGDAEMLEYVAAADGPSLAILVNHDDAEREYAYDSEAGSFVAQESVRQTASRLGWTQVSMREDWDVVFAAGRN